jgi:hypothetical protein
VVTRGLFRPAWPPLVGLAAGLIVFVVVLLDTPPGFSAVGMLVTGSARGVQGQAAAYAAGAAAALGLVTLRGEPDAGRCGVVDRRGAAAIARLML